MKHYILFTGHMIDKPDRKQRRFPKEKEKAVTLKIKEALQKELKKSSRQLSGIAGGACGGDIIFHELCVELNIPSEIYLALPPEEFKKKSVSFAGKSWDERFDNLMQEIPFKVLSVSKNCKTDNVWERENLWMLDEALKHGGENMTLIALWDGKDGDGDGGTEHMIELSKQKESMIRNINITQL